MTRQMILILLGFVGGIVTNVLSKYLNFFWEIVLYVFFAALVLYAGATEPMLIMVHRFSLAWVISLFVLIWLVIGAVAVLLIHRHYRPTVSPEPKQVAAPAPRLRLAPNLEPDDEGRVFRLSVWNDGDALAIADASIVALVGGEQSHEPVLPIVLGWMQNKQHLSPGDQGKIEVVRLDRERRVLLVGPGGFRHMTIRSAKGNIIPVSGRIRVTVLGTTLVQERIFELIPDESSELLYRPGPVTQPATGLKE